MLLHKTEMPRSSVNSKDTMYEWMGYILLNTHKVYSLVLDRLLQKVFGCINFVITQLYLNRCYNL